MKPLKYRIFIGWCDAAEHADLRYKEQFVIELGKIYEVVSSFGEPWHMPNLLALDFGSNTSATLEGLSSCQVDRLKSASGAFCEVSVTPVDNAN